MLRFPRATHRCLAIGLGLLLGIPAHAAGQESGRAPDPTQRVILVTGSTSGLGREVARALAADGDHVIVHGRSQERGLALVEEINSDSPGSARFYQADFASLDQVRGLAEAVMRDYNRLDVLVNNAGILLAGEPERRLSLDGYELTFQVNYLAGYLLTDLLLPLIRESVPARIVNVVSTGASPLDFENLMLEEGYRGGRAYNQSKLAQVMHTIDLRPRRRARGNRCHSERSAPGFTYGHQHGGLERYRASDFGHGGPGPRPPTYQRRDRGDGPVLPERAAE